MYHLGSFIMWVSFGSFGIMGSGWIIWVSLISTPLVPRCQALGRSLRECFATGRHASIALEERGKGSRPSPAAASAGQFRFVQMVLTSKDVPSHGFPSVTHSTSIRSTHLLRSPRALERGTKTASGGAAILEEKEIDLTNAMSKTAHLAAVAE